MSAAENEQARRPRLTLAGLLMLTTVTGVIGGLGAPMVPAIAAAEDVSLTAAQWSLTLPLLVGAIVTPIVGRLGSGRRRRTTILVCLTAVAAGSLAAALPLGFAALIVGRALQGIGFAMTPLAISIARDVVPDERVTGAVSALSVASVASAGLGFPVAALLADGLGVKGAFGAAFACTVLTLAAAVVAVPKSTARAADRVDWFGALLLGSATLCLLLVIGRAHTWGYTSALVACLLAGGVALLAASVAWMLRRPNPLVDLRIATRPGVLAPNLAALAVGLGMYILIAIVMVLVQSGGDDGGYGLGHSVTVAGIMMLPYAVASAVGSRIALLLSTRFGPDLLLPSGCVLFCAANLMLAAAHTQLWHVAVVMAVAGLGAGATFNSMPWLMIRVVPAAETASALAFNVVLRFLGFSLGSAVSVVILEAFGDSSGRHTETGFVVGALTGAGVCACAAVGCVALARSARTRRAVSGPAARGNMKV
ncbi:MFS transporter [Rhodococcus sp. HNM0569]|uniref:MFS transporter n=1 Tax=Rhodococcus sp. HNM0569 TaxID=2716340 RepID=UPI00146EE8D3|nr:MFS transporter [Rhodococcus sp. HNM0569]NLU84099.1 MFS transporter [Rhodococcus sp. HNM0569]